MPCNICFPRTEDSAQKYNFVSTEEKQECCGRFQSYQKIMPEVHPAVVGLLQQVYMCGRAVLGG